jgi:hypothetical protein
MKRSLLLFACVLSLLAPSLVACGSESSVDPGAGPTTTDPTLDPDGVAGCGPGPTPSGVSSWEPCPSHDPSGPGYQLVEPRDGLVDPHPVDWLRAKVSDDDMTLTITFWSGVEECYGVSSVDVKDPADGPVEVTIYEGRDPDAETCIEIAVKKAVRVTLESPLGDRKVIDGS